MKTIDECLGAYEKWTQLQRYDQTAADLFYQANRLAISRVTNAIADVEIALADEQRANEREADAAERRERIRVAADRVRAEIGRG